MQQNELRVIMMTLLFVAVDTNNTFSAFNAIKYYFENNVNIFMYKTLIFFVKAKEDLYW